MELILATSFILCNSGFVVERYVHGMEASYNEIKAWNFNMLPAAFGAEKHSYRTYQVRTRKDLDKLLNDKKFCSSSCLQLVELYLPWDDAPSSMKLLGESAAKRNEKS